jgi:hypothetical protein
LDKWPDYIDRDQNDKKILFPYDLTFLCLYVDDPLITDSNEKEIIDFKLELMREFEMTDLGHISYFLGIEFYKSSRGLLMHPRMYT